MTTLLTGIISGVIALIVCIINNVAQTRRQEEIFKLEIKELKKDIERLEHKQEIHNGYMERIAKLEVKVGE